MAEKSNTSLFLSLIWPITFWAFLVIKWLGTSLAAWSWWWLLLPPVPTFWLALAKMGAL